MIEYTYIDNILRLKSDAPISPSSHVTVRREDSDKITTTVYRLGRLLKAEQSGGYYYRWYGAAPESVTTDNGPALDRRFRELPSSEEAKAAMALARAMLPTVALTADQTIAAAALYDRWAPGAYRAGDIRLAEYEGSVQPWRCRQGHNTLEHPDIRPDGAAWRTFWIPFHGTTPETAQAFVAPTMSEDRYRPGEYMRKDGQLWRCARDTAYAPEDDPGAWEAAEIDTKVV